MPDSDVFPVACAIDHSGLVPLVTTSIPAVCVIIAYLLFLRHSLDFQPMLDSAAGQLLIRFWFSHWGMDWLYNRMIVKPYVTVTQFNKRDVVDSLYQFIAETILLAHDFVTTSQTGQMRTYAVVMVAGLVVIFAIFVGLFTGVQP